MIPVLIKHGSIATAAKHGIFLVSLCFLNVSEFITFICSVAGSLPVNYKASTLMSRFIPFAVLAGHFFAASAALIAGVIQKRRRNLLGSPNQFIAAIHNVVSDYPFICLAFGAIKKHSPAHRYNSTLIHLFSLPLVKNR